MAIEAAINEEKCAATMASFDMGHIDLANMAAMFGTTIEEQVWILCLIFDRV
jgi:L-amino acid N-acyltransferase YncA